MSACDPLPFPDHATLERELAALLRQAQPPRPGLRILDRTANRFNSFPWETVRCGFDDGSMLDLHCKYASSPARHFDGEVRFGVEYEAAVYQRFLVSAPVSIPAFFGTFNARPGAICLVLEHLAGATQVDWIEGGIERAAAWLGRFHAALGQRSHAAAPAPLHVVDAAHFEQLGAIARDGAATWLTGSTWIAVLAEAAARPLAALLMAEPTLIHGEFFPPNVLLREDRVYAVDWESAAWASGALDLASLTEGWEPAVLDACEQTYRAARWGHAAPAEFDRALDAARIYWQLRHLGTCDQAAVAATIGRELEQLRPAARRLGLG